MRVKLAGRADGCPRDCSEAGALGDKVVITQEG